MATASSLAKTSSLAHQTICWYYENLKTLEYFWTWKNIHVHTTGMSQYFIKFEIVFTFVAFKNWKNKNIVFSNLLNSEQIHKNYLKKILQGTFWIFFKTSMCTLNVFFKHNKCPRFVITFSACNFEKCFINIINVKETFLHLLHEFLVGVSIVFQGLENYFTRITYGLFEGNF